jgi:hypothetical protein
MNNTPYEHEEEDDDQQRDPNEEQYHSLEIDDLPPRINYTRLPISDFLLPEE